MDPEQRLSVAEAVTASTRWTLDSGQPADLVVVEADPYTVAPRSAPTAISRRNNDPWDDGRTNPYELTPERIAPIKIIPALTS